MQIARVGALSALALAALAACGGTVVTGGGSGGAGGSGGTGAAVGFPECAVDGDCIVIEDCCECVGAPVGSGICKSACKQSVCSVQGIQPTGARCVLGACVLDVDCNQGHAQCFGLPPDCPPGQLPTISSACWSGGCSDVTECSEVTSCADCAAGACVTISDFGQSAHCVDPPAACGTQATCACMGEACPVDCGDTPSGMDCFCPDC
jgi:hypothetical protein